MRLVLFSFFWKWETLFPPICAHPFIYTGIYYSFWRVISRIVWVSKTILIRSDVIRTCLMSHDSQCNIVFTNLCVLISNSNHRIFALFDYTHLIVFVGMWNIYLFFVYLFVYSSIHRYWVKKYHYQFNTICTRKKKTNQIENVVWVNE